MVALDNRDVVRHSRVAHVLEPFERIVFHPHQTVGGHEMALWLDGFAFARGEKIFSTEPPKTENGDGHARANRGFEASRFLDVEMARKLRPTRLANRFAQRNRRGADVPDRDGFAVM